MQDKAKTPAEIDDKQLDDISGGPHFRNFHGSSFDFAASTETVSEVKVSKQYDVAWDVEANVPS